MKVKLDEVLTGSAGEYREPLEALQNSMHVQTQVAGEEHTVLLMKEPQISRFNHAAESHRRPVDTGWDSSGNMHLTDRLRGVL